MLQWRMIANECLTQCQNAFPCMTVLLRYGTTGVIEHQAPKAQQRKQMTVVGFYCGPGPLRSFVDPMGMKKLQVGPFSGKMPYVCGFIETSVRGVMPSSTLFLGGCG